MLQFGARGVHRQEFCGELASTHVKSRELALHAFMLGGCRGLHAPGRVPGLGSRHVGSPSGIGHGQHGDSRGRRSYGPLLQSVATAYSDESREQSVSGNVENGVYGGHKRPAQRDLPDTPEPVDSSLPEFTPQFRQFSCVV
jgi:hypothetical protein